MSEWISVEDRLPEGGVEVFVSDGVRFAVAYIDQWGRWDAGECYDVSYDMSEVILNITPRFWKLPEPPKESN